MIFVSRFVPYSAIALWPFIFIKEEALRQDDVLIHHERIHHRQQLELLVLPFYVLYVLNYFINLLRYKNHYRAYREICFEREAFASDGNLSYLHQRKLFAFLRFL